MFPDPCVILDSYGDGVYLNISLLGVAAVEDDLDLVERSLSGGCDSGYDGISTQYFYLEDDEDGFISGVTSLHIACIEGSMGTTLTKCLTQRIIKKGHLTLLEVIKRLLRVPGLDVNVRDQLGLTPVYDAASWGYSDIVRLLVRAGADPDIPSNDGSTPAHVAASYGYAHTIEVGFMLTL